MATAAQAAPVGAAPKSKKKLLIIVLAVTVLLIAGGVAGLYFINAKRAAEAAWEDDHDLDDARVEARTDRRDLSIAPVFVPLDLFTVNLADREADRYVQASIALEVADEKAAETLKQFMPVIRNSILMTLSYKTSAELLERGGKVRLAEELRLEISHALDLEVPQDPRERRSAARAEATAAQDDAPPRRRRLKPEEITPIKAVHFANFIIQ
jgi:flagellar FliL protein